MIEKPEPASLDYQILIQFLFKDYALRPRSLAEKLHIRHSTINSALKRLEYEGYLKWIPYGEIELSDRGRDALKHIEVHHHLIETFLVESLGLSLDEAHEESLRLSPHFSCGVIKKICDKYKNPEFCPSNIKIPDCPECHIHKNKSKL